MWSPVADGPGLLMTTWWPTDQSSPQVTSPRRIDVSRRRDSPQLCLPDKYRNSGTCNTLLCSYFSRFSAPARILICLMICWFRLARLFCSLLRPVWAKGLQPWDREEEERVSRTHFNQETFTLKMIITALFTAWTSAWQQPLNKYVYSVIYKIDNCILKPLLVSGFVLTVFSLEPKYDPEHIKEVLRILNSINLCIWCRPVMVLGFRFPFSPPNQCLFAAVPY